MDDNITAHTRQRIENVKQAPREKLREEALKKWFII